MNNNAMMLIGDGPIERDECCDQSVTNEGEPISLAEFTSFLNEIREQPSWRSAADKEMDYKDGNQLDSELLVTMKKLGIPPAQMPLIGLSVEAALGAQARRRTDWRVEPDSDSKDSEIATALNFRLNEIERRAHVDRSLSKAYESAYGVGIGWIEVEKNDDPFDYPYRTNVVHRNEMFWDLPGYLQDSMGLTARYLIRQRWFPIDVLKLTFPDYADVIEHAGNGWFDTSLANVLPSFDGGESVDLYNAMEQQRGWTIEEYHWRNTFRRELKVYEVCYRRWVRIDVIRSPSGKVIEFNRNDPLHVYAVTSGRVKLQNIMTTKVRKAFFVGPHKVSDEPSRYTHKYFSYIPLWGHREDRTGVPYGRIRWMMFMQDNLNSAMSKIRWGLARVMTVRTKGAYDGTNAQLRKEIAHVNADIVLNAEHMAMPGARFEVKRDFELNQQQYQMFSDSQRALDKLSGLGEQFLGMKGASSNVEYENIIEQSNVSLTNLDDNYDETRQTVGHMLLSMLIQDIGTDRTEINITGSALKSDRSIVINEPTIDAATGITYLSNDVQKVMLRVVIGDVPQSKSYLKQQLAAFSEAFKSTTPEYQTIMMPHMIQLMDIPDKADIIKAMQDLIANKKDPNDDLIAAKIRELEAKITLILGQAQKVKQEAVAKGTEAQFSAMQAGATLMQDPRIGAVADQVMIIAGHQEPTPAGVDPNYSVPTVVDAQPTAPPSVESDKNTSPLFPDRANPGSPKQGIETPRFSDNIGE